jgi:hypothetical protein
MMLCRCGHFGIHHELSLNDDGPCQYCKCPEYRCDGTVYPVGEICTS